MSQSGVRILLGMGKTKHESLGNINFKAAYDPDSVRFPNGICSTCSRNFYRRRQWDFTRKFFSSTKLTQCINKAQRSGRICGCLICKTVRLNQVKSRWRQRTSSKPRTERIFINCGSIFYSGKYIFLKTLMHVCKLSRMPHELNCIDKCILNGH